MIEPGIQQLLTSSGAVSNLVGTRIYPVILPENGTFPAATYQLISTTTLNTISGAAPLARVRLQVDAWGDSYSDAKATALAVNTTLEGFHGPLANGTVVASITVDTQQDLYESAARLYRVMTDYLVWFYRS